MSRFLAVAFSILVFSAFTLPQTLTTAPTSATTSDPQALTLAASA